MYVVTNRKGTVILASDDNAVPFTRESAIAYADQINRCLVSTADRYAAYALEELDRPKTHL